MRLVLDAQGEVIGRQDYGAYGSVVAQSGLMPSVGYAGMLQHHDSGINLTWYRGYQPAAGRWLSRDPIEESGGLNLFGYVHGDPLNFIDPEGLWEWGDPLPSELVDACAGFGDGVSFGVTGLIREFSGLNQSINSDSSYYVGGLMAGALVTTRGYSVGPELSIGRNFRLAPWGNRTGHPYGKYPHYHRRGAPDGQGKTPAGQGIGRHRPWEAKSSDKCPCDRF